MRYPNLRYGKREEFEYYAMGIPLADLSRIFRRDERTLRDWLSGRARVPWWAPEIMRLKRMEWGLHQRKQDFYNHVSTPLAKLGVVTTAGVLEPAPLREKKKPQMTDLRLDDFDPPQARRAT